MTPITMKKSRPAVCLSVLCDQPRQQAMIMIMMEHTTTLGIRSTKVSRFSLQRRFETVDTEFGEVQVKLGVHRDQVINVHPEFDDCLRLADNAKVPVDRVFVAAQLSYHSRRDSAESRD